MMSIPIHELLKSATAIDARLARSKQVTLVSEGKVKPVEPTYSVYKLTDGAKGQRASKSGLTKEAAEAWVSERSDDTYEIEAE